ncbi:DUF397 domain-containing protein [Actinocatenispora rupis]|uniref:DUF397 domain-containing protein n=1 Tax=Actinocatenispora rupis TaxID=519421 RepID=UPI001940C8AE|nr:DUF397 domain-containing protein [Actinocatenispora rupis]
MPQGRPTVPVWRKSSRSNASGNCIEVMDLGERVAVRDSKDPAGPMLVVSSRAWRRFVASETN